MIVDKKECGSPSCLVDGLKEAIDQQGVVLREQHRESREFMRDLMTTHVEHMTAEIQKTSNALDNHAKYLYPMLRDVQMRITKIETDIGVDGIDTKIGKNETVKWVARRRSIESKVASGLMVALIIAIVTSGIVVYMDYYQRNRSATHVQQVGK